jgi:hypothetical protein
LRSVSKRLFIFAGLLAAPVSTNLGKVVPPQPGRIADYRLVRLQQYLAARDCPLNKYAADLIEAADNNDLDWRLLPSISVIESSGGKYYMNNNVFGWKSCKERFPSVRDGIHYVASRLANSDLYREKSLDEKLKTYNPVPHYSKKVKFVMRTISGTDMGFLSVN